MRSSESRRRSGASVVGSLVWVSTRHDFSRFWSLLLFAGSILRSPLSLRSRLMYRSHFFATFVEGRETGVFRAGPLPKRSSRRDTVAFRDGVISVSAVKEGKSTAKRHSNLHQQRTQRKEAESNANDPTLQNTERGSKKRKRSPTVI